MAITNHERVAKGLEVLKQGLGSFAEREWKNVFKDQARAQAARFMCEDRLLADKPLAQWDAAALLKLMWEAWHDVFRKTLGQADDVEVGGQRGREALDRLRNVVGRVESSWRPASAEEGFEIVRRRLFESLSDPGQFKDRDVVARAFADLYRTQHQEFPPECRDAEYEKRIKAAYPIHPEVFDRLYTDWSTLVKFQRTRGVLRLMAAVIHSLWEKGDRNPLILPANIPIDDQRVQFELTRYLSDNWLPILERDVDGPNSLPLRMDGEVPNLGKYHACRRVARTIYLGSAPTPTAANRGLEDRRSPPDPNGTMARSIWSLPAWAAMPAGSRNKPYPGGMGTLVFFTLKPRMIKSTPKRMA